MSQLWGAFWCLQILWLLSKKNPGDFFYKFGNKITSMSISLVHY